MNFLYGELVFCNDNTLRITKNINGKIVNIPLVDVQQKLQKPEIFILQFLSSKVKFEKGLTLSNFILSLRPWSETLTYYLKINFEAYCKACFSLTTKNNDLDHISIQKEIYVVRKMFRPKREKGVSIAEHINKNKLTETKDFETQFEIRSLGVSGANEFSLTGSSFNSIKNTTLILNDVLTLKIKAPTNHEKPIFSEDIAGLTNKEEFKYSTGEITTSNTIYSFSEVIQSIFNDILSFELPIAENEADVFSEVITYSFNEAVENLKKPKLKLVGKEETNSDETKVVIQSFSADSVLEAITTEDMIWSGIFDDIASNSEIIIGKIVD